MKETIVVEEIEVDGVEMIDLGDAMVETRQPYPIWQVRDSLTTWTYVGFE